MNRPEDVGATPQPVAVPVILALIAATHFAYVPLAELQDLPILLPGIALAIALGGCYAFTAWLARRGRGFRVAIDLVVGENLGLLAAGFLLGYPWGLVLRPGTPLVLGLQLALTFAEIWRRQESGKPIVGPARLAWFVIASALALAVYAVVRPAALWTG